MKIQLTEDYIRWRINETELAQLLTQQTIILAPAGGTLVLSMQLSLQESDEAACEVLADCWRLRLPRAAVENYAITLPNREGLALTARLQTQLVLPIVFEVDVRDSVRLGRRPIRN
jgi:hypothetical protein